MKTCRHLRFQLPREDADELRDADPEPCEVCDSLPHRRARVLAVAQPEPASLGTAVQIRLVPAKQKRFSFREALLSLNCFLH